MLVKFLMKHAQGSVTIAVSASSLWAMPVDRPMVSDESASITGCDAGVLGAGLREGFALVFSRCVGVCCAHACCHGPCCPPGLLVDELLNINAAIVLTADMGAQ